MFRMGQSNIINKWNVYNNSNYFEQKKFYSVDWSQKITNLGLSWTTDEITAIYYNSSKFDLINSIDLSVIKSQPQYNPSYILTGIATSINYFYLLFNYRGTIDNDIYIVYKSNLAYALNYYSLVQTQGNITLSRDGKNLIMWTSTSDIDAFTTSSIYLNWFYRSVDFSRVRNNTFNDIEFSLDGRLAIFQYDNTAPLVIYDLTTHTVLKTKSFSTIINQVMFLDTGTLFGVCLNYSHMEIYDVAKLTLRKTVLFNSLSNYSAIHYQSQTLYQCLKGNISAIQMTCPALSFYNLSTFSCIECNLPQNCTQCDASTGECTACQGGLTAINGTCILIQIIPIIIPFNQTQYSPPPTQGNSEFGFLQGVAQNVANNSGIISVIILSIQMSPFSMVFIQFISFWNICCLYSLVNLQNSVSIPLILQQIYNIVQTSLFQFLGLNFNYNVLSNKNLTSQYPSFYNVQTDVINSNIQNIVMMGFMVTLVITIKILKETIFRNMPFIKHILSFSRIQVILGQFISFIPMSILPLKNFIHSSQSLNSSQKLNNFSFIILVFCFIISPFYILIHYQNKILKFSGISKNLQYKKRQKVMAKKDLFKKNKLTHQMFINQKKQWVSSQAEYKFLNSFVNLCIPITIILPYKQPFFVITTIIYGYQVHVATKLHHYKIVSIILSSIFLHFHLLYLICYFTSNYSTIFQFVSLICFTILVLGGLIELLAVFGICFYEILSYLKKFFKKVKTQFHFNKKKQNNFQRKDIFGKKKCVKNIDLMIQNEQQVKKKQNFFKQQKRVSEVTNIGRIKKRFQFNKYFKRQPKIAQRLKDLHIVNRTNEPTVNQPIIINQSIIINKLEVKINDQKAKHKKMMIQPNKLDKIQEGRTYKLKIPYRDLPIQKKSQNQVYIYCDKIQKKPEKSIKN